MLRAKPLKSIDLFIYLSSNISSIESDVNICIVEVLTTIERLLIIRRSNLLDKIKRQFFQYVTVSVL